MGAGNSKLEKSLGEGEGERYYGLENFGNTCYGNSVLQILYCCKPFRDKLLEYYVHDVQNIKDPEENLLTALADLFYQVRGAGQDCRPGAPWNHPLGRPPADPLEQEADGHHRSPQAHLYCQVGTWTAGRDPTSCLHAEPACLPACCLQA